MKNRRDFVKELVMMSLLFPIIGNISAASRKKVFIIGGQDNFLIIYDMVKKETRKVLINFRGHSYVQNPLNRNEIIITQKTGGNWCVFDLEMNKIIKTSYEKNFLYYGHITFSENNLNFYRPRSMIGKKVVLEVVDSKNYNVVEIIRLKIDAVHAIEKNDPNSLVLTSFGHLNQEGIKENGLVLLDLLQNKITKTVKMETNGLYPTHLLGLGEGRYIVSTEVPWGTEKKLNITYDQKGVRDFSGALFEVNLGGQGSSKKIILPTLLEKKLKNNTSNFIFEQKNKLIYFENIQGDIIFTLDSETLGYANEYPIRTHGLFLYQDKVYISNGNDKFDKFVSVYKMCKENLTNTHFSIVEV